MASKLYINSRELITKMASQEYKELDHLLTVANLTQNQLTLLQLNDDVETSEVIHREVMDYLNYRKPMAWLVTLVNGVAVANGCRCNIQGMKYDGLKQAPELNVYGCLVDVAITALYTKVLISIIDSLADQWEKEGKVWYKRSKEKAAVVRSDKTLFKAACAHKLSTTLLAGMENANVGILNTRKNLFILKCVTSTEAMRKDSIPKSYYEPKITGFPSEQKKAVKVSDPGQTTNFAEVSKTWGTIPVTISYQGSGINDPNAQTSIDIEANPVYEPLINRGNYRFQYYEPYGGLRL